MPTVTLHARTVHAIKPTPGRRMEYFDAATPGLALRVTPTGAKSWALLYRHRGRLRRLTLGSLKVLSLAQARDRARDALRDVTDGSDPGLEKRADRSAETVAALVDRYLTDYAKLRKRSWKEDERILTTEVLPRWRHRAVREITRDDVLDLLDGIVARGAGTMANRTLAVIRKMFNVAIAGRSRPIDHNPAAHVPAPAAETSRDRVLTEAEIRAFWTACDALDAPMAAFYRLRLLTAQRGIEVASLRWQDIDLHGGWWTVPAGVSKNKLAHRVPLSPTALRLLKALRATADTALAARLKRDPKATPAVYVLDGARGKRQQAEAAATFGVEDFRGHDLRRTAASLMAGGGVPRLHIAKVLNHVEGGPAATRVYDRYAYDVEKRQALERWAQRLSAIIEGKTARL